jgi:hypothetical protein
MFNTEEFYLNLSDYFLKIYYTGYLERQKFYLKGKPLDLAEDIKFMKNEILIRDRNRKLKRLNLVSNYSKELEELKKIDAPEEFINLLSDCKTKQDAQYLIEYVNKLHILDPYWEENWLD